MYDALLIVSFGGPEKHADVLPFLQNVTRGRNIPEARLLEVAEHYFHFGGKSPINDQCRDLIEALRRELAENQIKLPIYWGNRNWHPFLADTLRQMREDGIKNALAFMTSAYSSYSGCRQYRENVSKAQEAVGAGVPNVDKLRVFYNHPGFIEACSERVKEALNQFSPLGNSKPRLIVTAHSIPLSMSETSAYETQLLETARLVAEAVELPNWELVFQSRSGPPTQPWLGPDILESLKDLHRRNIDQIIVAPLGFLSDHMEVLYDLDSEASELAQEFGMNMVRARTVGTHPAFIRMLRQLVVERCDASEPRLSIGNFGPNHDVCPANCCPAPQRAGRPLASEAPSVSPLL